MEKYYKFNICSRLLKLVENELPKEVLNIFRRYSDIVSSSYFTSHEKLNEIQNSVHDNIIYNLNDASEYEINTKYNYTIVFECEEFEMENFIHCKKFKFSYIIINDKMVRNGLKRNFIFDLNKNIFDYLIEVGEKEYKKEIIKNNFI